MLSKSSFPGDRQIPSDYNMVFWTKELGSEAKHMDMSLGPVT